MKNVCVCVCVVVFYFSVKNTTYSLLTPLVVSPWNSESVFRIFPPSQMLKWVPALESWAESVPGRCEFEVHLREVDSPPKKTPDKDAAACQECRLKQKLALDGKTEPRTVTKLACPFHLKNGPGPQDRRSTREEYRCGYICMWWHHWPRDLDAKRTTWHDPNRSNISDVKREEKKEKGKKL